MSVSLTSINRVSADISRILNSKKLYKDSVRIDHCFGWKHCHSSYCIKCMSRRVFNQRKHLEIALPSLLSNNPTYELWFITSAAADSQDVTAHAKGAVLGLKRLLKHKRLKSRVISHFSVLEVALKRGRPDPCSHVHTLLVTRPISIGRHRISEADWIKMWEVACPLARMRDPQIKLIRKNKNKKKAHLSIVAELVPRTSLDIARVIQYCTKWANVKRVTKNYRALLVTPDEFIERIQALKGVTRFFGDLHLKQNRTAKAPAPVD